jgi:hypothetical protein
MNAIGNGASQLSQLGRKSYVSQSGMSNLLKELHAQGLPAATSRASIQRAREATMQAASPFGPLLKKVAIALEKPTCNTMVSYIDPVALLAHMAEHCVEFSHYLHQRLKEAPPTPQSRWNIVVYSDEVTPGNQLKHDNKRKVQAVYWSFAELGAQWLSSELSWFVLTVVRSSVVNRMAGGMSTLLNIVLQSFFKQPHDLFDNGIVLHTVAGRSMLFATLGCMISDESAIKQSWACKGSSGTMLCLCCRNVVAADSELHNYEATGSLVPSTETDVSKFALHADASIRDVVSLLRRSKLVLNIGQFNKLQQACGFNWCPTGLLASAPLANIIKPISMTMWDWMHIYIVNGTFNLEVGLLLGRLARVSVTYKNMHNFVQGFVWPARLSSRSASGIEVFEKRTGKVDDPLKCSASECLSVYGVLRLYLMQHVHSRFDIHIDRACECCYLICHVLDLLLAIPKGQITVAALQCAIDAHSKAFQNVYGTSHWIPKHHYALHLPAMMKRHKFLLTCFVHERKHKIIKRLANQLHNTSAKFEASILEDAHNCQMSCLSDPAMLPNSTTHLTHKRKAPTALTKVVQEELNTVAEVWTSAECVFAPMQKASRGDVAVALVENQLRVVEIWFHVQVESTCLTCVSCWTKLGNNCYQVENDPVLIPSSDLRDTCVYSRRANKATVVPMSM